MHLPVNHKLFCLLFTITCLIALTVPAIANEHDVVARLIEKARNKKLHEERAWQVLLHYTKTLTGGYESRIDDPAFFASPEGRTNGQAELEATLRSFFMQGQADGENGACRFPARLEWLASRLELDLEDLPEHSCNERDESLAAVDAKSAVLVFPVGHINSPASMFGHTLIRIDGSGRSQLVSHAVNYAAETTDTNGFIYAWKGLTGGYRGYFSLLPYYTKVKEYNDLEHRDMWEYRLKLSEEEVMRMVTHIWELYRIGSSYYFLDENCSYNLLFLIEAARPELNLVEKTGLFVLPTDTIRIVQKVGMLEDPVYRPSQGTRIKNLMARLSPQDQQTALAMANGDLQPVLSKPDRIFVDADKNQAILNLAAEFAQFQLARKKLDKTEYNRIYLNILGERSKLGTEEAEVADLKEPPRPESGHDTSRLAVGGGIRNGKRFAELAIRPSFHTLTDPDQGYLPGAQITFLDTVLRFSDVYSSAMQLQSFRLLDIFSATPRDIFFKPFSWKVNAGIERETMRNGDDKLIVRINSGGGFAYKSPHSGIWYALAEADFNAGSKIRGKASLAPGLAFGGIEQITDWWKLRLQARSFIHKLGDNRTVLRGVATQNFRVSRNNSITVEIMGEQVSGHRNSELKMLWNYYF